MPMPFKFLLRKNVAELASTSETVPEPDIQQGGWTENVVTDNAEQVDYYKLGNQYFLERNFEMAIEYLKKDDSFEAMVLFNEQ
jgi:hypothetical protein